MWPFEFNYQYIEIFAYLSLIVSLVSIALILWVGTR